MAGAIGSVRRTPMIRKRGRKYAVAVYNPAVGKKVHVGTYAKLGSAREEGTARWAEADAERRFAESSARPAETVASFGARWLKLYPRPQATTNAYYAEAIEPLLRDFAARPLDGIGRAEARQWIAGNRRHLQAARAFFNDAIDAELCERNPFAKLGLSQPRGRRDLTVLTEGEVHELADAALVALGEGYGSTFRACILFAAYVCLRPAELFDVERAPRTHPDHSPASWIDLGALEVHVNGQVRKDGRVPQTKNGRRRTVILPPPARDAVAALPAIGDDPHLFTTAQGRPFTRSSHFYYWNLVRTAAGRRGMDFYELRHFGATHLLELGVSHADVAVQLGHTDGGALVMSTYGHPSEARARERLLRAYGENVTPLRAVPG